MKATIHPDQWLHEVWHYVGWAHSYQPFSASQKARNNNLETVRDLAKHTRGEWLKVKGLGPKTLDDWEALVIMAGLTMGRPGKPDPQGLNNMREAQKAWMYAGEKVKYQFSHKRRGWLRVSTKRPVKFLGGNQTDNPKYLDVTAT